MLTESVEEIPRSGLAPERPIYGNGAFIERAKDFVLLVGRCGRKFLDSRKHCARDGLKFGNSIGVKLAVTTCKGFQCAIDELDHACFASAGRLVGGDNARRERVDFCSLLRGEEFEFRRRTRLHRIVRVLRSCQGDGPVGGDPCGRKAGGAAYEKAKVNTCSGDLLPNNARPVPTESACDAHLCFKEGFTLGIKPR